MARPRDAGLDRRILAAASALLAEAAYEDFSIEEVARRAEVSRPSVYRRWPTPAHLAFAATMQQVLDYPPPDTGAFRDDLVIATAGLVGMFEQMDRRLMSDRFHAMMTDTDFAALVDEAFLQRGLRQIAAIWERGVARGEVRADVDPLVWFEDLSGVLVYRVFILHRHPTLQDVERLVDTLIEGTRPDAPATVSRPPGA